LALEVPAARWPTENQGGNSRSDPAPGTRKSGLGSSKIHGELQKLGFAVSETSVVGYVRPRSLSEKYCAITAGSRTLA
jgi:hypothetical protein